MIVRDGIYYALALVAGGVLVRYLASPWFALPLFILAAFCLFFFATPSASRRRGRWPYRPPMARSSR